MFLKIFQATFLKCFLCLWKVFFPKFLWFKKQDLKCCFTIYFNAHNNATFFIGHMILSEKSDKILFNKKIFKSYLLAKSFLLVTCDCFIWPLLTYLDLHTKTQWYEKTLRELLQRTAMCIIQSFVDSALL